LVVGGGAWWVHGVWWWTGGAQRRCLRAVTVRTHARVTESAFTAGPNACSRRRVPDATAVERMLPITDRVAHGAPRVDAGVPRAWTCVGIAARCHAATIVIATSNSERCALRVCSQGSCPGRIAADWCACMRGRVNNDARCQQRRPREMHATTAWRGCMSLNAYVHPLEVGR
jgi:hypothetical protein